MSAFGTFLTEFVMPAAVILSAAATTTTAAIAWRIYQATKVHDRALFGEEHVDGHDGMVEAVNENTERSELNRRVLRANDLVPNRREMEFYRGGGNRDDENTT